MSSVGLLKLVVLQWLVSRLSLGGTHYYDFVVETAKYTRLCSTKQILTVNRQFPGPTLYARRGDTMVVKVCNLAAYNVTIHWHGVKMPRNPWSDGPAYITQCPIKPGGSFTYIIDLSDEEGTVWWHAHTDWIRATVHGAIVVYPKLGDCYPFPKPHKEFIVILGEWWKKDVTEMYNETRGGLEPEPSDAYTINGQPGDLYPCSKTETFTMQLEEGNIYLLRTINAGLTNAMFVSIAGHEITMVGSDGSYIKPITTQYFMISPGETMDLLIQADQNPNSLYYLASRALNYEDPKHFDTTTATAIITYRVRDGFCGQTPEPATAYGHPSVDRPAISHSRCVEQDS
ncbi:uncharacterized protein A4U43_C08F24930 [Asparagus officinalis]|nr:uncharacterized protein A4U43_C08F24930 [Asparagus officinalis]